MRLLLLSIGIILCLLHSVQASELERLFGEWGSDKQCARARIAPQGTVFAAPIEIRGDWLAHGNLWCRLTWTGTDSTVTGLTAFAQGFCGEDSVRDYQLKFKLEANELHVFWNTFYKNGPLSRCE